MAGFVYGDNPDIERLHPQWNPAWRPQAPPLPQQQQSPYGVPPLQSVHFGPGFRSRPRPPMQQQPWWQQSTFTRHADQGSWRPPTPPMQGYGPQGGRLQNPRWQMLSPQGPPMQQPNKMMVGGNPLIGLPGYQGFGY